MSMDRAKNGFVNWVACRHAAQPRVGMSLWGNEHADPTLRVVTACHPR